MENFYAPFPNIAVEVVGNTLAMIINMRSAPEDRLFVLDWKAGYKRLVRYPFFFYITWIHIFLIGS